MRKALILMFLTTLSVTAFGQTLSRKDIYEKWDEISKKLNSRILGKVTESQFLELNAKFDECGEWGGHYEKFKIFRKNDSLFTEYKYFEKNCKNRYSSERKTPLEKIFYVGKKKEKIIENYLIKLLSKSLKYEGPSHAGNHYNAKINSDLNIKVHDVKKEWSEYEKFKKKILR